MKTATVQTRGWGRQGYRFYLKMPKEHILSVIFNLGEKKCHIQEFKKFNIIPHLHSDLSKFNVREKSHPRMVTKLLLKARYCIFNASSLPAFFNKQKIV